LTREGARPGGLSRIPRSLAAAALVAFGILLPLGGLEVALRIYDATRPAPPELPASFWRPERPYGWLHVPNMEGRYFDEHGEFSVTAKISTQGLRDVDHAFEKPAGVFRILLLGDSYMEGMQVEQDQIFARTLEKKLNDGGRRVEVINACAAGWGTDNELIYLREVGFRFSPDLVLLAFTTANDVRNNSMVLNPRAPEPHPGKTMFTLSPEGSLVTHEMPVAPPIFAEVPWWRRSRVLIFLANRIGGFAPRPADDTAPAPSQIPIDLLVCNPEPSAELKEAWAVTNALLREVRRETESHGARFAMFLVNGPWAHVSEWWKLMTMWDHSAQERWNPRQPNRVFAEFNREWKADALDLLDSFDAAQGAGPLYFRNDPHWTPAGHRIAADAVASFLVESKLVP
jgi:hypothetical protein